MSAPSIRIEKSPLSQIDADWLVVGVAEETEFSPEVKELDNALGGVLEKLRERGDIKAKAGETTYLPTTTGIKASRLLVLGLGNASKVTQSSWEMTVGIAARRAAATENQTIAVAIPTNINAELCVDQLVSTTVISTLVGSSGYALYKATPDRFPFKQIIVATQNGGEKSLERGRVLGNAVNLTRELVNRHPEDIIPVTFAERAAKEAQAVGLQCEIFDLKRLQEEQMGSLLAVARGSKHEPRVVILKHQGGSAEQPYLALCGKGVTFDSGGLSIKPSDSMVTMKGDMAGGATVLGAMTALANLKAPVNVIGVIGLVENMLGSHCYKLGEVLTARNGVTIEVHNTDAEGRLVLADVLSYVAEQKPAQIIDLATLTGACVVALGPDIAGAFSNDQTFCDQVLAGAKQAGEELWQMPMYDSFNDQLKCDIADVKNVGTRWGGAITAAKFLEKFVDEIPWVHLDIAGPSYADNAKPGRDVGGTGMALRTLVAVAENLASK
ncbi:leucyl aminopeptidase [Planctomicrobium sp. SH668]|uniref:leucyl aminopeptidase n=1 Tax=Planctomicrobium sp. SH668 TaxID=3448126 RepID=UPI003F5C8FB5